MASFEQAKQAVRGGAAMTVHHRTVVGEVQGGGIRKRRVVVATWAEAVIVDNYAVDLPMSQDTDELTREQADELVKLGAADERDEEAMAE